jgi:hypothetical protein
VSQLTPPLLQLTGAGQDTGWIDVSWLTQDASFSIYGTWTGTIAFDQSDEPYTQGAVRTSYSTPTTYTVNPTAPQGIPRNIGQVIRLRSIGPWTGTAKIGFSNGIDSEGNAQPLTLESARAGNQA